MLHVALVAVVLTFSVLTLVGQAPLPLRGQGPGPQGQGGQGRGRGQAEASNLPANPVVSPLATISAEVTGPGKMFPGLMSLPEGDDLAHFKYEEKEYFASGTANGQPYKTRIVIRRPTDNSRFSGFILAESMHPSGNAWMFHFTHTYTMASGHIGLEIVTSDPGQFVEFNQERYKDLKVQQGQGPDIIGQVGAWIRSKESTNPLSGLPLRKMVLAGTSASAGALVQYLPNHMAYRLPDMKPIYDGFLPTSNGANIRQVDVPLIQIPTITEASGGNVPTRQDSDAPGDQYRDYEFSGMAHLDTRNVAAFRPNPCKNPISMYPLGAYMAVGLHHLLQWVDKGVVPPRADRLLVDRNAGNDGSLMALDEFGNPRGGIRSPYVDVPVVKYAVRNEGAVPPTPNTVPWVALRGEAGINQLCGLTGYQIALTDAQLKKLYTNKKNYQTKVAQKLEELTRQGWSLPVYKEQILADAAQVNF
jgi:hypothetical protein